MDQECRKVKKHSLHCQCYKATYGWAMQADYSQPGLITRLLHALGAFDVVFVGHHTSPRALARAARAFLIGSYSIHAGNAFIYLVVQSSKAS